MDDRILKDVADYYRGTVRRHGATAKGVDWNSEASQKLRFDQLLKIRQGQQPFSINDYGCGYGALADYLLAANEPVRYCGYDLEAEMVRLSRLRQREMVGCRFESDRSALGLADYTVASGVFNVKLSTSYAQWTTYMREILDDMAAFSLRGFAFNALSSYSDPDRRRTDLYYADPRDVFDHCKRHFSDRVALLHDYPLYEFTVLVRVGD